MDENAVFTRQIDLNNGHDIAHVSAIIEYHYKVVELSFSGRDPTRVIVRLRNPEDARAVGEALIMAANAMDGSSE